MNEIDRQFVTFSEVADETNDNKSNDDDYYTDDDLCAPSEAEMFSNNECSMMNVKSYVPFLAQCTLSFSPKNLRKLYSFFTF